MPSDGVYGCYQAPVVKRAVGLLCVKALNLVSPSEIQALSTD